MNPQNGLRIRSFKNATGSGRDDRELLDLTEYLLKIKDLDTFERLNHSRWRDTLEE
jgi:ubiquitin-like domain-containing CTD phosphatase 1